MPRAVPLTILVFSLIGRVEAQQAVQLLDINPGANGSFPAEFTLVNGELFFSADDGANGRELWKTDGTMAGTVLVRDINGGALGSNPFSFLEFNNTLFFAADDGVIARELWKSDGTVFGTIPVRNINIINGNDAVFGPLVPINGGFLFPADDGVNGRELWISDGTLVGTVLLADIQPGAGGSSPGNLTAFGQSVVFQANDGVTGNEPWVSDGTAPGTLLLGDIQPGAVGSFAQDFSDPCGGVVFFRAIDGVAVTGAELYSTDGTALGTGLVKDINPGAPSSSPQWMTCLGGLLYFSADDGVNGDELYQSDGTAVGTVLVKDINPGAVGSNPSFLRNVNGILYFVATDGTTGPEPFVSDGTAVGTALLQDITPGAGGSFVENDPDFTEFEGFVFFNAEGPSGEELYKTNGGASLFQDINPGAAGSSPTDLTVFNPLILAADDGVVGKELFILPSAAGVFTVDSTVDAVDAVPGDGFCATAINECTLRAAIQETNALAGANTIELPGGGARYNLTIPGAGEDAAATGDLDITDDLTITRSTVGAAFIDGQGLDRVFDLLGAITVTIQDAIFIENGTAVGNGGGIRQQAGTLNLLDSVVVRNNTSSGSGGGISSNGVLNITDGFISNNLATVDGGGIDADGDLTLTNSTVDLNRAGLSGGLFLCGNNFNINGSTIRNNQATAGGAAGGIWNECGTLTIDDSTISGNTSADEGGGITNDDILTITDSTISGNSVNNMGGGIMNPFGDLFLTNVTISNNSATTGGGIYINDAAVDVKNTIIASNPAGGDCFGAFNSFGNNLDSDGTCPLGAPGDLPSTNPLLGPLQDNGGPTQTQALLAGSPAIDAGDNPSCSPDDQRGTARFDGDGDTVIICDIGAFEFDGAAPPPPGPPIPGDCNGDGMVSAADLTAVLKNLGSSIAACDGDQDGTVETEDIPFIFLIIIGGGPG